MRWSWRIGRLAGIDLDLHATFLLLLAWIAISEYQRLGTVAGALNGVLFILAVFASVVIHEYGHALTGARFGIKTKGITLLPIGGIARMEEIPENPRQELAIAVAGPATTIAIVIVLFVILRITGAPEVGESMSGMEGPFLARLMWVNIVLAVFNLLPAFPMDGGRVLRAALAMRMDHAKATAIATQIGRVFALAFGLLGLFVLGNPFLVLIAVFVWFSAAAEAAATQLKAAVGSASVRDVMITDVRTMTSDESLSHAVEEVRSGFQHDFPVVDGEQVTGVLTREALLKALAGGEAGRTVGEIMQRSFVTTTPEEPLQRALARLQSCHCRTLPVVEGRALVGVLTMDKVGEFVRIEAATHGAHAHPASP